MPGYSFRGKSAERNQTAGRSRAREMPATETNRANRLLVL